MSAKTAPDPPLQSVSRRMSTQATRDTQPELAVRRIIHLAGLRYRVHYPVPGEPRRSIDIAFPGARVAVFVDGCYWHGCRRHKTIPVSNAAWWHEKIRKNRARDRGTDALLRRSGWKVIRVWEHELPEATAALIVAALKQENLTH